MPDSHFMAKVFAEYLMMMSFRFEKFIFDRHEKCIRWYRIGFSRRKLQKYDLQLQDGFNFLELS